MPYCLVSLLLSFFQKKKKLIWGPHQEHGQAVKAVSLHHFSWVQTSEFVCFFFSCSLAFPFPEIKPIALS